MFALSACTPRHDGAGSVDAGGMPLVAVSILPQTWFVREIAGDKARIVCLTGPGQNPHDWEPTPRQMADLARAAVWIRSGSEFEISLQPKIAALYPNLRIVSGVEGVRWRPLEEHDDDDNGHDAAAEREGGFLADRHSWLGEEPAVIMARAVRDALTEADGANAAAYAAACDRVIADITAEFARLRRELAPLRGSSVFVYHPAFGYFLDEFGIHQEAVETGGKEPTPRVLTALIARARRERPAAIFVQAQFPVDAARTVAAAVGTTIVSLDPLAPDWIANIRALGAAFGVVAGDAGGDDAGGAKDAEAP